MKIIKIESSDLYRQQQFLDLPAKIYRDITQWVPPLASDSQRIFDQPHNPFFAHSTAAFFLALASDGTAIGRLAVMNNKRYNSYNHEQTAFFYLFECTHNPEAAGALF